MGGLNINEHTIDKIHCRRNMSTNELSTKIRRRNACQQK